MPTLRSKTILSLLVAAALCLSQASEWSGVVSQTDPETGTLTFAQEGNKAPLTLRVTQGDALVYGPGDHVRGEREGDWLQTIWPAGPRQEAMIQAAARSLRADTLRRGRKAYRTLGERLPNFALYNQDGEIVQSRDLRGEDVVINFIFTRCTDPQMCPLSSRKMAELQDMAAEQEVTGLRFVTVSFDPAYDTPGRLRTYANAYEIDTANYDFLTGPDQVIVDLMNQLGVLRMDDEELIFRHTLATMLIAPDGTLYYRVPNSRWSPEDFLDQVRKRRAEAP